MRNGSSQAMFSADPHLKAMSGVSKPVSNAHTNDGELAVAPHRPLSAIKSRPEWYRKSSNPTIFPLNAEPAILRYEPVAWSSYAASYHPRHILVSKPDDQGSRWQSGTNNQLQFLTLKLDKPAVVHTITFGKFHRVHVCNLKEFKVFGGLSEDGKLVELLHGGLRNDTEPETFSLRWQAGDVILPVQYIKIVPLLAWGANFNFSVWHVKLKGVANRDIVNLVCWDYVNYRETEAVRLMLKHFRQRNMPEAFNALQQRTNIDLEAPLVTALHRAIVIDGDVELAERLVEEASNRGCFLDFLRNCSVRPVWRRITPEGERPAMRGGHQMCIDSDSGKIYLFGGWDGAKDLCDFWEYDQKKNQWTCLSRNTHSERGPMARSCHKLCFNSAKKHIYMLGRYVDQESRAAADLNNDFWCYDIKAAKWCLLSANVAEENGPELIYDHQMVIDGEKQQLYIFGGRITCVESTPTTQYSGLYRYDIATRVWTLVKADNASDAWGIRLRSRIGHSMLLNPLTRELYIFAGQRNKDYLSDFYIYELDTDTVHELTPDYSKQGGPDAGFTQRATIDKSLGEFYVLSGLMREKNSSAETVKNTFWVYQINKNRWTKVYQNENKSPEYWADMADKEPCPRFAHQLVYDSRNQLQFLFGGNPGEAGNPNLRLDDFWELKLVRPVAQDVLRYMRFSIRTLKFKELCLKESPAVALKYLQTSVSSVVLHEDPKESKKFRELSKFLFQWQSKATAATKPLQGAPIDPPLNPMRVPFANAPGNARDDMEINSGSFNLVNANKAKAAEGSSGVHDSSQQYQDHAERTALFESLLEYFPQSMGEPVGKLVDLVPLD